MKNLEQELKLQLSKREYDILQEYSQTESVLQTNHYFAQDNMPSDVMFRLRVKCGKYLLCYKKLLSQTNGVTICDEREKEISEQFAQQLLSRGIFYTEVKSILGVDVPENLTYVGSMDTYRTKFALNNLTLELDYNKYLDTVDYELECECDKVENLEQLQSQLVYLFGITPTPSEPKSKRFFAKLNNKK